MQFVIKKINHQDIKQALKIYNYYIENSLSNFEEKKISIKKFRSMVDNIIKNKLPFIVAKKKEGILGLAFLRQFRSKSGYRFTFENSIYVHPDFQNKGIGNLILKKLISLSKKNKKIKSIVAVIGDKKNISSVKLHKRNGFKMVGIIKKAGYKKNKWIDSIYMQKIL